MPKREDTRSGWESQEDRDLAARRPRARSEPRPDRDTDEVRAEMRNEDSDGSISVAVYEENTGITQRIADDPDLARLFHKVERLKVRMIDASKENADRIMEALGSGTIVDRVKEIESDLAKLDAAHDPIRLDVATIKSSLGIGRWVLGFVIVCALGSLGTVIATVWGKGEAAGEQTVRIQHLERDLESLRSSFFSRQQRVSVPTSDQSNSQLTIPKGSNSP